MLLDVLLYFVLVVVVVAVHVVVVVVIWLAADGELANRLLEWRYWCLLSYSCSFCLLTFHMPALAGGGPL